MKNLSATGHRWITATGTLLGSLASLPVALDQSGMDVALSGDVLRVLAWCAVGGLVAPLLATWLRAVSDPQGP
jgi:hypothetical protein